MKVALIGLGRMGSAMAVRVLSAGHDVLVYNRTPEKTTDLVRAGARAAASIPGACADREFIITMVSDDAALREVVLGDGGVRNCLPAGAIHIVMGTHSVAAIRAVAEAHREAGQQFVAAPVLGRPEAVAAGQLGIIVAGPAAAVTACAPIFQAIGRRVFEAGTQPESASALKLANNFVLACCIELLGEAAALVRKYAVPAEVLMQVLTEGLFAAPAFKTYGRIIAEQNYDHVGFTARLGLKDMSLVLAAADAAQVPLPSAHIVRERLLAAIAHGDGECDWSVIAREQARASGLK